MQFDLNIKNIKLKIDFLSLYDILYNVYILKLTKKCLISILL